MRTWIVVTVSIAAGCTLDDVDFGNRRCPCAESFRCDEARDLCVPDEAVVDAGAPGSDAGGGADAGPATDGGPPQDGPSAPDADPSDASRPDDGGPADAGPDPTACDDTFASALFCDGFERDLLAWAFDVELMGMVAHHTTSPIYRGVGALHAETRASSGKASVTYDLSTAVSTGELHARGYFFVPATPAVDTVSLLFVGETAAPNVGIAVQIAGDRTQVYLGTEDRLASGRRLIFPRDRWVCVTLDLTVGNRGAVTAALDGMEFVNESLVDTAPAGDLGRLTVGVEFTSPATAAAIVYADEIVLDRAPVACD
jgi:hypothetical protein